MPITGAHIKKAVLDGDDFGFEMRVGKVIAETADRWSKNYFNGTDLSYVGHGGTYTDSVTSKPRQFDYRLRVARHDQRTSTIYCAELSVECKNLHESSPLVIFGRARTAAEAYYGYIRSQYTQMSQYGNPKGYKTNGHFYHEQEFVGKSILRVKENQKGQVEAIQDSDVYDKWAQAIASSVELVEKAGLFAAPRDQGRCFSFFMPVVVVPDELLWRINYDANGSISSDPVQVQQCDFFVERKMDLPNPNSKSSFVLTHVHFVTLTGFAQLLNEFVRHTSVWEWIFVESAELMAKAV